LELQEKESFADSKRNSTHNNAINTINHHDLDITRIDSWKFVSDKERDRHDNMPLQQKQNHTHYAPMTIKIGGRSPSSKRAASPQRIPVQHLGLPLSAHVVRCASSSTDLNQEKLGHPLLVCISVTSAIELITGLALRTPAAV